VVGVGVACLLHPEAAYGDDHVPVALDYAAPPECPAASGFLDEVAARTAIPRPAQPDEPATTLTVIVRKISGGFKGTLEIGAGQGSAATRQVAAADCEQVVSALALMTALAIDPNASAAPVRKQEEPPPRKPEQSAPRPESARAPASSSRPTSFHWRYQLGAALELVAGVAPEPFLLLRPSLEAGTTGSARWGAAFRLGAGLGSHTATSAEFSLVSGRLEGCPRFRAATSLEISLCAAIDAGRLEATGVGVTPIERVDRPWVAPGATARLEWEFVHFLVVEVAGEAFVPVVRDRFFIGTNETVGRAAAVVGGGVLGLGLRYP
jgi:hypothetical protein